MNFEYFGETAARLYAWLDRLGFLWWVQRVALRALTRLVEPPAQVLEIGPGPGRLASMLSRRGYHVVGVDASMPMLKRARADKWVDLLNGVSWALPIPGKKFDCGVAVLVVHHWGDHDESMGSICRVLKDGAPFIVVEVDTGKFPLSGAHGCTAGCLRSVLSKCMGDVEVNEVFPLLVGIGRTAWG